MSFFYDVLHFICGMRLFCHGVWVRYTLFPIPNISFWLRLFGAGGLDSKALQHYDTTFRRGRVGVTKEQGNLSGWKIGGLESHHDIFPLSLPHLTPPYLTTSSFCAVSWNTMGFSSIAKHQAIKIFVKYRF